MLSIMDVIENILLNILVAMYAYSNCGILFMWSYVRDSRAWAPERGTGPKERVAGPRVFDIAPFLGKGGLLMIILCNFDDSKTTFSGRKVFLYLGLVAEQKKYLYFLGCC
jgi:hypothetical protein